MYVKSHDGSLRFLSSFQNAAPGTDQDLLVQANEALLDIEAESEAIFKVMKEQYGVRFPELATFELQAVQYAKVVLLLAGEDADYNNQFSK